MKDLVLDMSERLIRGGRWRLALAFRLKELWVGVRWEQLGCGSYEVNPEHPVTKIGWQRTNVDVLFNPLPCVCFHFQWWRY